MKFAAIVILLLSATICACFPLHDHDHADADEGEKHSEFDVHDSTTIIDESRHCGTCSRLHDKDVSPGDDIAWVELATPDMCCNICHAMPTCVSWSWSGQSPWYPGTCYMHNKTTPIVETNKEYGVISGIVDNFAQRNSFHHATLNLPMHGAFCGVCERVVESALHQLVKELDALLKIISELCPPIPFVQPLCHHALISVSEHILPLLDQHVQPGWVCIHIKLCHRDHYLYKGKFEPSKAPLSRSRRNTQFLKTVHSSDLYYDDPIEDLDKSLFVIEENDKATTLYDGLGDMTDDQLFLQQWVKGAKPLVVPSLEKERK